MKLRYIPRKHISHVELLKDQRCNLGISVTDIQKDRVRPTIKSIKNGSTAQKSHSLAEGDVILSIGDVDTLEMKKKKVKSLLADSGPILYMKVEYYTQQLCFNSHTMSCSQRMFLTLRKENESFGFVIRKNDSKRRGIPEYPVISNIKPGGPADKEGSMMAGDRLLEVNNQTLSWMSLIDAVSIFQEKDEAVFLIEYTVGIVDLSKGKETEIELDCLDMNFGMTISATEDSKKYVGSIQQGSLAQRCGAFHVGDEIMAINGVKTCDLTASKAMELLQNFKKVRGTLTFISNNGNQKVSSLNASPMLEKESPPNCRSRFLCTSSNTPIKVIDETAFVECGKTGRNFDDGQLKTISIIKDINLCISDLNASLLQKKSCKTSATRINENVDFLLDNLSFSDNFESNKGWTDFSKLQNQIILAKKLVEELAIHVLQTATPTEQKNNLPSVTLKKDSRDDLSDSGSFIADLIDNFSEIANHGVICKSSLETLTSFVRQIEQDCIECGRLCYIALFAVRKILLLLSMDNITSKEENIIQKVIEQIKKLTIPCEKCRNLSNYPPKNVPIPNNHSEFNIFKQYLYPPTPNTSYSNDSSSELPGSSFCSENKIKFDMAQQKAIYKLIDITSSDETDEELIKKKTFKEAIIYPQIINKSITPNDNSRQGLSKNLNGFTKLVSSSQCSNILLTPKETCLSPQVAKEDTCKKPTSGANFNKLVKNKAINTAFVNPNRNWKSSEMVFQSRKEFSSERNFVKPNSSFPLCPLPQTSDVARDSSLISFNSTCSSCNCRTVRGNRQSDIFVKTKSEFLKHCCHQSEDVINSPSHITQSVFPKHNELRSRDIYLSMSPIRSKFSFSNHEFSRTKSESENNFLSLNHLPDHHVHNKAPNFCESTSRQSCCFDHNLSPGNSLPETVPTKYTETREVELVADSKNSFGFSLGYDTVVLNGKDTVPIITAIQHKSPAYKCGVIENGDRVLSINGRSTNGLSAREFDAIKREFLTRNEIILQIEYDVQLVEIQYDTFTVNLKGIPKLGLICENPEVSSVIKGVVNGSLAHRSGQIFPYDKIISLTSTREEIMDFQNSQKIKQRNYRLVIQRDKTLIEEANKNVPEKSFDPKLLMRSGPLFTVMRTCVRTVPGQNGSRSKIELEQEFILFRDPSNWDYGFQLKEELKNGKAYVVEIKPGGPAANSKVIKKYDRIMKINGIEINETTRNSATTLLTQTTHCVELLTHRTLGYK